MGVGYEFLECECSKAQAKKSGDAKLLNIIKLFKNNSNDGEFEEKLTKAWFCKLSHVKSHS